MAPGIFRRGLTLPTRELKYGFQGTINAKNLRQDRFSPPDGGLACSDEGAIAPLTFPWRQPLVQSTSILPSSLQRPSFFYSPNGCTWTMNPKHVLPNKALSRLSMYRRGGLSHRGCGGCTPNIWLVGKYVAHQ